MCLRCTSVRVCMHAHAHSRAAEGHVPQALSHMCVRKVFEQRGPGGWMPRDQRDGGQRGRGWVCACTQACPHTCTQGGAHAPCPHRLCMSVAELVSSSMARRCSSRAMLGSPPTPASNLAYAFMILVLRGWYSRPRSNSTCGGQRPAAASAAPAPAAAEAAGGAAVHICHHGCWWDHQAARV